MYVHKVKSDECSGLALPDHWNRRNIKIFYYTPQQRLIIIIIIIIIIIVIILFLNYESILNSLNFRRIYSRYTDVMFLINVFKGKINSHSIVDTVDIRVPTRQIREFSTFSVSRALRHSPTARFAVIQNDVCWFIFFFFAFLIETMYVLTILSRHEKLFKFLMCILLHFCFTCFV
jgi:hypothetical protein